MRKCNKCSEVKSEEDFYKRDKVKLMTICKSCTLANNKKWSSQNKEKHKELVKKWESENKDKRKKIYDRYRENHPEKVRKFTKVWRDNNKPLIAHHAAKRRADIKSATPKWVDDEELKYIYENCPVGYHVDHIIPLKNEIICGLHIPDNLQYLAAIDNHRKKNKFESIEK